MSDTPPSSRRPRRRKKSPWKPVGITVAVLAGLGLVAALGVSVWIKRWLHSAEFQELVNAKAGAALQAECEARDVSWQDSAVYAGEFRAQGLAGAAFQDLRLSEVRAELNTGALWDRKWQVDGVRVAAVELDLSPGKRATVSAVPEAASVELASETSPPWYQRFLPNRAEVGTVRVDEVRIARTSPDGRFDLRSMAMEIRPSVAESYARLTGTGGTAVWSGSDKKLEIRQADLTARDGEVKLDGLTAALDGAHVTADGALRLGGVPHLTLHVKGQDADLERWISDDWLKRLTGKATMEVRLQADPREPERWASAGTLTVKDGLLQALPVLEVIARKTRNESFLRMTLREARTDFRRESDGSVRLEKLLVDAPGLLRLKGTLGIGPARELNGDLLVGVVPGTLRYLAGAEQTVFLPAGEAVLTASERASLTSEDLGLLWCRMRLTGTLDDPQEDLADRLAMAWFNATADQVAGMTMEGAAKAAEAASKVADTVLDQAPGLIERAPGLLSVPGDVIGEGLNTGKKVLDSLLPR